MKKYLLFIVGGILLVASFLYISDYSELQKSNRTSTLEQKALFAEYLKSHPFNNRTVRDPEELKKMPKADRPDLAIEQNILMTMDPKTKKVPYEKLFEAYRTTDQQRRNSSLSIEWSEHGPTNVGGRTRAVMFDPNDQDAKKFWAGAVSGGLWYTDDITADSPVWHSIDDFWDNLAISSLAYDPTNTQVFYAGTGEGFFNADAVRGGGIWKTTDGGVNWTLLDATTGYDFYYVTKIVVHPTTGDVYATTRASYSGYGGVMKSTDDGESWTKVLHTGSSGVSSNTNRAADIEIGADGTIYAAMGLFSTDGIYASITGNEGDWTKLNTGSNGFPNTSIQRIEIACAPSNANYIYALVQGSGYEIDGIYKTTDRGNTWSSMTVPVNIDGSGRKLGKSQTWYDLIAAVDPTDEDVVYAGGVDVFKTTNGGTNWSQIAHWWGGYGEPYVHADQHSFVFRPGYPNTLAIGNDGGIHYTTDGGVSFDEKNSGYNVTQYYACALHPSENTYYFLGGTQDNGSHKFEHSGLNAVVEVSGGDGAFCFIDQDTPDYQITSYVYNNYYRSTNGGGSFYQFIDDDNTGRFINPTAYDSDADILYSAETDNSVKRVRNVTGTVVEGSITGLPLNSLASALSISPYTDNRIFVGSGAGYIIRIDNANLSSTYADLDPSGYLPSGYISSIQIGESDDNLLVTYSNYSTNSVWETKDGGTTWVSKEGNLPDMPVRWALYNPTDKNQVMLATEIGVWVTSDLSVANPVWEPANGGLAHVRVDMLQTRASDNFVIAATHGRGIYSTDYFASANANFTLDNNISYIGKEVAFTDISLKATSWSWDFGDGETSTNQNPVHTYNDPGVYTVTLSINGNASTKTITDAITVLPHKGTPFTLEDGGDFEDNFENFVSASVSGGLDIWERGTPGNEISDVSSGVNVWKTDLDADVPQQTFTCALYTPNFNFKNSGTYMLEAFVGMEIYYCNAPYTARVEYSTDMGDTWQRLGTLNDPKGTNWYNEGPGSGTACNGVSDYVVEDQIGWMFSGTQTVSYDCSFLAGQRNVAFRFILYVSGLFGSLGYQDGFLVDDFKIMGPPNDDIPVEVTSFNADVNDASVQLNWVTATEINNNGFEIQRATITEGNYSAWEKVGFVKGTGNSTEPMSYTFSDDQFSGSTQYAYRLKQIDYDGSFEYSEVVEVEVTPIQYTLEQNYPNPFNPATTIKFSLPVAENVTITVYNQIGEVVKELVNQEFEAGHHKVSFNANDLASGMYIYTINAGDYSQSRKMILMK